MSIIEVKNISKQFKVKVKKHGFKEAIKSIFRPTYRKIDAVNDISFEIDKGEVVAFIGPNGAGKSTLIKMMTGILYSDDGAINVLGLNPNRDRKKLAYRIGTVFGQKEQLWIHLSPFDNFKFFGAVYDLNENLDKRINELSKLFELEEFIDTPVKSLSLGQRIRCELVASLIHNPEILFLDEPTIGLDPVVKTSIRSLIKKMNKELGTTVFLTSHDVGDIERLCKRVIIINKGTIVLDDKMTNLRFKYFAKKIIELKLSEEIDFDEIEGVEVVKKKQSFIRLQVDMNKRSISDIINLIDLSKVLDITISHIPLETIITDIYKVGA
ncbi:ATP-binding cassette domain-containing protein [Mycoplasmatota bacterium zrk1]